MTEVRDEADSPSSEEVSLSYPGATKYAGILQTEGYAVPDGRRGRWRQVQNMKPVGAGEAYA